jgi:hypothetical protein
VSALPGRTILLIAQPDRVLHPLLQLPAPNTALSPLQDAGLGRRPPLAPLSLWVASPSSRGGCNDLRPRLQRSRAEGAWASLISCERQSKPPMEPSLSSVHVSCARCREVASDVTRPGRQVLSRPSTARNAAPQSTPRERHRQVGAGLRSPPSSTSWSSPGCRWQHSRSARARAQSDLQEAGPAGESIRVEVSAAAGVRTAYSRAEVRRYARQIPVRYAIPCDGLVRKAFSVVRSGRSSRSQR